MEIGKAKACSRDGSQEEAQERARKCKQRGMVVPLAMGLSKRYKFTITMTTNKDDEDKTPPPFIATQMG